MTGKMFDGERMLARQRAALACDEQPVRAELRRRLEERLAEVKGAQERVLWVAGEGFEAAEGHYDAVLADMVLPLVEDVPMFMGGVLRALRPDGLVLMTTLGMESFRELRAAWAEVGEPQGHVIALTDVREVGGLLQRLKVALPVVDRDVVVLTFADFAGLYATLRAHGVGNFNLHRRKGLTTPRRLRAMEEAYRRLFVREDGRLPLTLEVVYLHGFRPADNQPLPRQRGSGKVSLVRILGDT